MRLDAKLSQRRQAALPAQFHAISGYFNGIGGNRRQGLSLAPSIPLNQSTDFSTYGVHSMAAIDKEANRRHNSELLKYGFMIVVQKEDQK